MQKGYCELYDNDDIYNYNLINRENTYNNRENTYNNRENTYNKDNQISLKQYGFNPLIRFIFYFTNTSINLKE